jgi:hypothetical protein
MGRIKSNLSSRVKKGKMSQAAADAAFSKVKGTLDYASFGGSMVACGWRRDTCGWMWQGYVLICVDAWKACIAVVLLQAVANLVGMLHTWPTARSP